jgi:hypothetical protein
MRVRFCLGFAAAILPCVALTAQSSREVRTFPQFAGVWAIDHVATTGRMTQATAVALTIATSPTEITVARTLDLPPERPGREGKRLATNNPLPELYRVDGTPTIRHQGQYELSYTFVLVADALALTEKRVHWVRRGDPQMAERNAFTMTTDAFSVDGDVLTVHRQLTSVNGDGEILGMATPANNVRQSYVYRRVR